MTGQELSMLALRPLAAAVSRWWAARAEQHYLICAEVEEKRAKEALQNVAYYQKQAALARSRRI